MEEADGREFVWAADAFRLTWDSKTCHDEKVESDEAVAPTDEDKAASPSEKVEPENKVGIKEEPKLALLQALVDDVDAKVLGSTLEPVAQCPATARRTFHHDALQKGRRAQATFHFDAPRDGCYIIEEMHPQLEQCKASASTNVDVSFCKGRKARGIVDQTSNGGQWTFLAALPFFAGHPGNVTLNNEGTEPGTLTVFDQVRFTWSGKSCSQVESHPRKAEIRFTVDFKAVENRQTEFGTVLKRQLAKLAGVPERTLRLTGLRSGSIIASFLVFPSAVDEPLSAPIGALQTIEKLRDVVANNADDLCALTGDKQGCEVQFTDLGRAQPSIRPVGRLDKLKQEVQETANDAEVEKDSKSVVALIVGGSVALISLLLVFFGLKVYRSKRRENKEMETTVKASAMEEGKAIDEKKPTEEVNDNASTVTPSSDKQSEPSLNGDVEDDVKSSHSHVDCPAPALTLPAQQAGLPKGDGI